MRTPDYASPLLGWRVWRVHVGSRGATLLSAVRDDVWPVQSALAARCEAAAGHTAPDRACSCGLHATRDPRLASRYLLGRDDSGVVARVVGLAALWGTVVECEHGWRAERAYPAALWVPGEDGMLALALTAYGIPVSLLESSGVDAISEELSARA